MASRDDRYAQTAPGKAGRSAHAFVSIAAAARKAEELQIASKFELGNYAQTITFDNFPIPNSIRADVETIPGRNNVRVLLRENRNLLEQKLLWPKRNVSILHMTQDICSVMLDR